MGETVLLEKIYRGTATGSIGGPKDLCEKAKSLGYKNISLSECKSFLESYPAYTLNKPARKRYPHNKIIATFCGDTLQIDIMDMQWTKSHNDGYLYVLVSYDTYSKFLSTVSMKNRSAPTVLAALKQIIDEQPFKVTHIYWDKVTFYFCDIFK